MNEEGPLDSPAFPMTGTIAMAPPPPMDPSDLLSATLTVKNFSTYLGCGSGSETSTVAKARILDIARCVIGISWASARAKTKKAALAEAMETAFAAGEPPVGLSAQMHAAALAWTPPGFVAFDTGRIGDEADGTPQAETEQPADTVEAEAAAEPEATAAADVSGEAPADASPAGNGHAEPAAPASGPSDEDAGDAGNAATEATGAGPATGGERDGIAAHAGPVNGHDPVRGPVRDPMEIPEFLRRVH